MTRYLRSIMLAALTAGLMVAACGPKVVRGQPPFAQVNALRLDGTALQLELGLRNINDEPMEVQYLQLTLTVQETELTAHEGPLTAIVSANGKETLSLRLPASETGRRLLAALEDGAHTNLPYQLRGSLQTAGDSELPFQSNGRLYPVPGRSGQFR